MKTIFDEEEQIMFVFKQTMLKPIRQQVPKTIGIQMSGPADVFTIDQLQKTPSSQTLWGGISNMPLTNRDQRLLKLRAMRGVMY